MSSLIIYPADDYTPTHLTPYDWAAYIHVWMLNEADKKKLDRHFIGRCTVAELISRANINHPWQEKLTIDKTAYTLSYSECSYLYLEELEEQLPNTPILISFRYSRRYGVAIALISLIKRISIASNLHKYIELFPKEVSP